MLVKAARTGSFRVDILNPLFQPAFTIVYHKGFFSLLSVDEGKLYKQRIDLAAPVYIGKIPVRPSFISTIIFGSPLLSGGVVKRGGFNLGLYDLQILTPDDFIYKLKVNPKGLYVVSLETYLSVHERLNASGPLEAGTRTGGTSEMFLYAIDNRFTSKGESDNAFIPSVIKGKHDGMEIVFAYDSVEMLKEIEDKEFELAVPSGIEVIYTDTFPL